VRCYGRFCESLPIVGATSAAWEAGQASAQEQNGQVSRALRAYLAFASSPPARGRSERAFGTLQGCSPPELPINGMTNYKSANCYLESVSSLTSIAASPNAGPSAKRVG
jgi:hypothetical protein